MKSDIRETIRKAFSVYNLVWLVYILFLAVLMPHTAWTFSQFQEVKADNPLAWMPAFSVDTQHGTPDCSERVKNGNNTEFCKCRHDAQTAKRLAAGERLAALMLYLAEVRTWDALPLKERQQIRDAVDFILRYAEL